MSEPVPQVSLIPDLQHHVIFTALEVFAQTTMKFSLQISVHCQPVLPNGPGLVNCEAARRNSFQKVWRAAILARKDTL